MSVISTLAESSCLELTTAREAGLRHLQLDLSTERWGCGLWRVLQLDLWTGRAAASGGASDWTSGQRQGCGTSSWTSQQGGGVAASGMSSNWTSGQGGEAAE
ncbi:hypothetical protein SKAU_G00057210 [Synaphobranchus kaupii]|uniref:Uncharacterized protein n=1 Tax=Synaphobranchus kaupii TaxID=118154 RepID=A0A9Q1G518_SYNKA|nr:hypothetical protein SKAU_G00057210 [Synaphobranchus kaupii]